PATTSPPPVRLLEMLNRCPQQQRRFKADGYPEHDEENFWGIGNSQLAKAKLKGTINQIGRYRAYSQCMRHKKIDARGRHRTPAFIALIPFNGHSIGKVDQQC